jgi:hypothetical protein
MCQTGGGTSVRMIERVYGTLLDGAAATFAARLDAYDAERERRRRKGLGHERAARGRGESLRRDPGKRRYAGEALLRERRDSNPRPPA